MRPSLAPNQPKQTGTMFMKEKGIPHVKPPLETHLPSARERIAMSALGLCALLARINLWDIGKHERAAAFVGLETLRARLLEQRLWL